MESGDVLSLNFQLPNMFAGYNNHPEQADEQYAHLTVQESFEQSAESNTENE